MKSKALVHYEVHGEYGKVWQGTRRVILEHLGEKTRLSEIRDSIAFQLQLEMWYGTVSVVSIEMLLNF